MAKSFVHYHNHTAYSLLDGAAKPEEIVNAAVADGQPGLGSTDHGNLYGVIEMYKLCKAAGIKYTPGQELYFADDRFEKSTVKMDYKHADIDGSDKRYYHLTMLAENNRGYHNMLKVSSDAFLNGYWHKPRTDWDMLAKHSEGLIVTTGCLGGPVLQRLLYDDFDGGLAVAARLQDIYGRDSMFIELMNHGLPEQRKTNPMLIEIGKRLDAPLLATNDCHYTHAEDALPHDALLCIQTASRMSDEDRFKFSSDQHYLKSAEEMRYLFREVPSACDNTLWIAERSEVEIDFGSLHLPHFDVPEEYVDDYDMLEKLTYEGLQKRYKGNVPVEATERAAYELGVVRSLDLCSYFLIFWDLVKFAESQKILTGPGRGSAAGSIISYALNVTKLDPLEYDLIFERFLNEDRIALPDIDWDCDTRYRDTLINYTREKYGEDHVAQIVTFTRIKARTAVRDASRVLGFDFKLGDDIAKLMPPLVMGVDTPLRACLEFEDKYSDGYHAAQGLRDKYATDPATKSVVDVALGLEDLVRQTGIHAAAVVIGDRPLDELVPLQRLYPKGVAGPITTQYPKDTIEDLGLLKMDYLALRNLDVIADTLDYLGLPYSFLDDLPLDDMKTYDILQKGQGVGVFQVESLPMRNLLVRINPNTIHDLAAVLALYRPGPMAANMHNDYADRKNGRQLVSYFHEDAKPIMNKTYGLMIYQEQTMQAAQKFAGYDMKEADLLRKIIGKKLPDMMRAEKGKFVQGVIETGYGEKFGEDLFKMIEAFAAYGFNASHAYAYAYITYWTAYLKANYPREYMACLCSSVMSKPEKAALYLHETRRMGMTVHPPDVNTSEVGYTVTDDGIRIGLNNIRNVGGEVAGTILSERPYKSLYDFAKRVNPTSTVMESLALSGSLDAYGTRMGVGAIVKELLATARKHTKKTNDDQGALFDSFDLVDVNIPSEEFGWHEMLAKEKEYVGVYISGHPLAEYEDKETEFHLSDIGEMDTAKRGMKTLCMVNAVEVKFTRAKHEAMAIIQIEDQTGAMEVACFPRLWAEVGHFLRVGAVVHLWIRPGLNDRDERKFSITAAEPIDSRIVEADTSRVFGVYLPAGFNRSPDYMSRLKGTLLSHHGTVPVSAYISRSSTVDMGNEYLVDPTDLLKEELKLLFIDFKSDDIY